ncbi:hypothetical protein ACQY0O_006112 [Thecaphora frezii]
MTTLPATPAHRFDDPAHVAPPMPMPRSMANAPATNPVPAPTAAAAWSILAASSPTTPRQRSSSISSVDSSDQDCESDQSDDIAPETGFDPFLAATRRARIHSASSPAAHLNHSTPQPSPANSYTTSHTTLTTPPTNPDAERWSRIDTFWSNVVEDTMFRPKQGPIDLSSKGITDILPKIADLSRYVALPPPRFERQEPQDEPVLPEPLQSKTGGLVRHESYLAPFSSHQHYDASSLGARAFARSKSAFQPSMRTHSYARTNSAMSALSSRSGGSNNNYTPGRYQDPRDRQATLNLFLAQNYLTKLPSALFQLQNLRVLSLRFNRLERLPPAIGELQNLTELNIANNQLRYLPAEILRLRLELFTWFPNPFMKPPQEARLTVRPLLSIKAKHSRHTRLQKLGRLDDDDDDGDAVFKTPDDTAGPAIGQPPPVIRFGAGLGGARQRTMDRTRSETQVEGFLARGIDRLGMAGSDSIQEDDESFDADSTVEAIASPALRAAALAASAAGGGIEAASDEDDERSRILAAAFEDSGSEDEAMGGVTAADASWLKGKVEGRSRILGPKEVAPLPTLQELCVRRLLGAYDAAEGEAQGLVSPFLSPMISGQGGGPGGRRRTGPRRNGLSKPGTPLWGATPRSSRTLSTRSISFSSSVGSESGLYAKRLPTLLEAYENGTLQSLAGELGRGLVPMLEAARRSATRDWGTKARMNRTASSKRKSAFSRSASGVFPALGDGAASPDEAKTAADAAGANDVQDDGKDGEEEEEDTFGGVEAVGSLDRGDDACDNPWFSRCPNPKHLCEPLRPQHSSYPYGASSGVGGGGGGTLSLRRGYGSSSSVSSLGTTLGGLAAGSGISRLRSQHDDESETRSIDSSEQLFNL